MKKLAIILVFSIFVSLSFIACSNNSSKQTETNNTEQTAKVQYTCSMHPEVVQDKPGKCPKCGMELVEKKVELKQDTTKR